MSTDPNHQRCPSSLPRSPQRRPSSLLQSSPGLPQSPPVFRGDSQWPLVTPFKYNTNRKKGENSSKTRVNGSKKLKQSLEALPLMNGGLKRVKLSPIYLTFLNSIWKVSKMENCYQENVSTFLKTKTTLFKNTYQLKLELDL